MITTQSAREWAPGSTARPMTPHAANAVAALAFLLVSVVAVTGCGGGGGGSKAKPTDTPTTVPTPVPTLPAPVAGAGLQSDITAVDISGGQIVVTFALTDDAGVPITPLLTNAPNSQSARVRFTSAHIETYEGGGEFQTEFSRYVNDLDAVRPKFDSNGKLETIDGSAGVYRYTFAKMLPAGADLGTTYSIGLQVDRTYEGISLSANPVFDIVPAGGTPEIREGVVTAQCNQCHNPLIAHGNRREVRLCTLCHTQAATDEKGTSIDLSVMIHKIHAGKDLPSVADGPPGSQYAIFSSFAHQYEVFASKDENGVVTGIGFPRPLNECANCHTGGATSHYAKDRPAAAPCTSCHDDVNPSQVTTAAGPPGTNHIQNRGFPDGDCQFCHLPEQTAEFDVSVPGAHVVPEQSQQLQGLNIEIAGLASHGPGQNPVVTFKVTNNAGEALRDLSGLNRLAFTLAGPTSEYTKVLTATAVGGGAGGTLSGPAEDGSFQYTLPVAVPADASDTWALGAEARRPVTLAAPEGATRSVNEAAVNPVVTFAVGDQAAEVRRMVVDDANCASCHGEFSKGFSVHGNLRNQTQYCVLCHNPNASDVARRKNDPAAVAAGDAVASIDFKYMIHKIHTGEELNNKPYVIYGFGTPPTNYTAIDFSEVRFPGDRRDCQTCHVDGSNLIPPYPGPAVGTQLGHLDPASGQLIVDGRLGPIASACTSCHDSDAAKAHAETQTGSSGEACEVCHAEGRDVAVSAAHVRNVQ